MKKIFARFKRIDNRLRPLPYTELLKDSYSTGSVVGEVLRIKRYSLQEHQVVSVWQWLADF